MAHRLSSNVGLCPPAVRPRLGPLQPHRHNLFCGTNPFCAPPRAPCTIAPFVAHWSQIAREESPP